MANQAAVWPIYLREIRHVGAGRSWAIPYLAMFCQTLLHLKSLPNKLFGVQEVRKELNVVELYHTWKSRVTYPKLEEFKRDALSKGLTVPQHLGGSIPRFPML